MSPPGTAHRTATVVLSALMVVLGVAIFARALTEGGGPLAVGVVVGVMFVAAGALRLWAIRAPRG